MDLLQELQSITNETIVKKSKGKTFNQRIVDELKDGKPVERYELITRIAMARAIDEGKKLDPKDPEFIKYFKKLSITCRNGVDTSLANGHTNSNFSYNTEFNTKWKLIKDGSMISLEAIK